MELQEWIDIGISKGIVAVVQREEMTFREVYEKWFLMKLNVIKNQSCDRIECTYNKYYKGSFLESSFVSALDEPAIVRFLTAIVIGQGGITVKEFGRIYQIVNNVLVYAKDLGLGGAKLLDWEMIKRYVPEGKFVPDAHQDFAVPKADIERLLRLVLEENIYPEKRSACLCLMLNFFLGLRVGELAALTWQDFDMQRNLVRIYKTETKAYNRNEEGKRDGAMVYRIVEDTKTIYSVREIPLLPEAVYILLQLRRHHEQKHYENEFLAYDGTATRLIRSLDRTLRRLCRLCEVTYFNTHCIRKTFATVLHESGMPTRYISDLLGHSEMCTTERNYILTYKNNYNVLRGYMHKGLDFHL